MQNMSKEPLFSLLSSKYIFWYCNQDSFPVNTSLMYEHLWCRTNYPHLPPFQMVIPIICVVSRDKHDYPILRIQGGLSTSIDTLMITLHNSNVLNHNIFCNYEGSRLMLNTPNEKEIVFLYGIYGQKYYIFQKLDKIFYINLKLDKGIYIIYGTNWSKKFLVF